MKIRSCAGKGLETVSGGLRDNVRLDSPCEKVGAGNSVPSTSLFKTSVGMEVTHSDTPVCHRTEITHTGTPVCHRMEVCHITGWRVI